MSTRSKVLLLLVLLPVFMGQVAIPEQDEDDFFLRAIGAGPISPTNGCDYNRLISSYNFYGWINTGITVTSDVPGPFGKDTGTKMVGSTGGLRVGYLTVPVITEDTVVYSIYIKNGNMTGSADTRLGFRDRTSPANYYAEIDWSLSPVPAFLDTAFGGGGGITGTVTDVGEYWYHVVAVFDAEGAGTEGNSYDARIMATDSSGNGNTIYVGAAQFEAGDGITDAQDYCETPPGYAAGQPATTYPYMSGMAVACGATNQYIDAATDVNCTFRSRWDVVATDGKPGTTWSAWTVTPSTAYQDVQSEVGTAGWFFTAQVEARDENNVPMSNSTMWDSFEWEVGGACP